MSSIIFDISDNIARITLNRPEKLNAFNRNMALELQEALDRCAADNGVKAIILTGSGRAFSAGQDLGEVTGPDHPGFGKILSEHYNPIIQKITALQKPVLAAVNGVAAGAGANIALACDIVIAARSASFIQAFSKIGLVPDSGGTFFLPRLIGWQKASALMMLGDKVPAEEAERMGMIYKFAEDSEFSVTVDAIAKQLAALPPLALALTKKALQLSVHNSLPGQLAEEDELQQQAAASDDYAQRVAAFMKNQR